MGSKASKITKAGASAGTRKYPTRTPNLLSSQTTSSTGPSSISVGKGPSVHPETYASSTKDDAIRQDAQDPDFANMLRAVGSVQQQQTIPDPARNVALNSESSNDLRTLSRRSMFDSRQASETETANAGGNRTMADTSTILQILSLRDEKGWSPERIEKDFKLAPGFLKRLGTKVAKP
ncbi:hypothetical protein DFP73DRAFT_563277 [Morchella snyderi]|nr:hypothetical protein DFP73DRAFT_563277 [Morchella snyderi]